MLSSYKNENNDILPFGKLVKWWTAIVKSCFQLFYCNNFTTEQKCLQTGRFKSCHIIYIKLLKFAHENTARVTLNFDNNICCVFRIIDHVIFQLWIQCHF